jgi:hypothetical protein
VIILAALVGTASAFAPVGPAFTRNVALNSLPSDKSVSAKTGDATKSSGGLTMPSASGANPPAKQAAKTPPITVQGGTLRTWSLTDDVDRVEVNMRTSGRPLNAIVELYEGPDNYPQKMGVYVENGNIRAFRAIMETPGGSGQNAVAIRNTAQMEFPLYASVDSELDEDLVNFASTKTEKSVPVIVQGNRAVETWSMGPNDASALVVLKTDGRPLNARIELLQAPNNVKEVLEIYTEDGIERPLLTVLETPGSGAVVRIVNTGPLEYPLMARVEPYKSGKSDLPEDRFTNIKIT